MATSVASASTADKVAQTTGALTVRDSAPSPRSRDRAKCVDDGAQRVRTEEGSRPSRSLPQSLRSSDPPGDVRSSPGTVSRGVTGTSEPSGREPTSPGVRSSRSAVQLGTSSTSAARDVATTATALDEPLGCVGCENMSLPYPDRVEPPLASGDERSVARTGGARRVDGSTGRRVDRRGTTQVDLTADRLDGRSRVRLHRSSRSHSTDLSTIELWVGLRASPCVGSRCPCRSEMWASQIEVLRQLLAGRPSARATTVSSWS